MRCQSWKEPYLRDYPGKQRWYLLQEIQTPAGLKPSRIALCPCERLSITAALRKGNNPLEVNSKLTEEGSVFGELTVRWNP